MRVITALGIIGAALMAVHLPALCWGLELDLPERVYQGDVIVGRVKPPGSVFVNKKEVPVSAAGYFAVGVPRGQKTDLAVTFGGFRLWFGHVVKQCGGFE